jgi:hypothetical protein
MVREVVAPSLRLLTPDGVNGIGLDHRVELIDGDDVVSGRWVRCIGFVEGAELVLRQPHVTGGGAAVSLVPRDLETHDAASR